MSPDTATAPTPTLLTFGDVLRIPVMRRVWYAQVVSLFGDFLALFAVIAVVSFRMHGTAAQLTGVQIAYMLPIRVRRSGGRRVRRSLADQADLDRQRSDPRRPGADADSGDVDLAGLRRAGGAELRLGVLRSGADGDDSIARADARVDLGQRADADRLHGQPHHRTGDRGNDRRALHAEGLLRGRRRQLPDLGVADRVGGDHPAGLAAGRRPPRRPIASTRSGST